jgi:NAD(P)-dependent dehydrogenase (short-subunit alcohol dehydrogenase family)
MLEDSVRRIVDKTGRTVEQARASLAATNPQGRFIQPQEVAAAVLWLCSEAAGSITGQAISLSGGET